MDHRVFLAGTVTPILGIRFNPLLVITTGPAFDITAGQDLTATGSSMDVAQLRLIRTVLESFRRVMVSSIRIALTAARGFVGVAFRVNLDAAKDVAKYDCFYLRPTNGRADDQVRRNHSTQYISYPDFPWFRLRKEFPEKYESYADVVPGEWTKLKIEVQGEKARLYVQGAPQPALVVNDLRQAQGTIALWVGTETIAHFANLRVSQ